MTAEPCTEYKFTQYVQCLDAAYQAHLSSYESCKIQVGMNVMNFLFNHSHSTSLNVEYSVTFLDLFNCRELTAFWQFS